MKPKKEMIRVVLTPEGEIVLDVTGKKNGRGAYVCKSPECLKAAHKNKGLNRSLKTNISEEIFSVLEKEMDTLG
ncbi:MAG: YlxR family protein [Lachnospiraceae bacterium]|nr:YlxR family protein [Lachnospiraceae bacterium]